MRELVLYKHGVGFFTRGGTVSGGEVALEAEEIIERIITGLNEQPGL